MHVIQQITNFALFAVLVRCVTNVRVKSGRQMIYVEGREPFMGNYQQLTFSKLHCIKSLVVDGINPLTGAEEVELFHKVCKNEAVWHLAHYSNIGGYFILDFPTNATTFAIVTHKPIRIARINIRHCILTRFDRIKLRNKQKKCMTQNGNTWPGGRKHQNNGQLSVEEYLRVKRNLLSNILFEYTPRNSPYKILKSIIIGEEQVLRIHAGTSLTFAQNAGITVHGVLQITGTKLKPVLLYALNGTWNGLLFAPSSATAAIRSYLTNVNISESEEGIRIESTLIPHMEHVISERNGNGITILAYNNDHHNDINYNSTLRKIITLNNRENGLSIKFGPKRMDYLVLDEVLSKSNQKNGLLLEGSFHVTVLSSQFYSNNNDGISVSLANGSTLELHKSFLGFNGQHDLRIFDVHQARVRLLSSNFAVHNYMEAMVVESVNNANFLLDDLHRWDDYNGLIAPQNFTNSNFHLLNGNWTLNRKNTVRDDQVENSQHNQFRNYTSFDSAIGLGMTKNDSDACIRLHDNRFQQNTVEIVLQTGRFQATSMAIDAKIVFSKDWFSDNFSLITVLMAGYLVNISQNISQNFEEMTRIWNNYTDESMIPIFGIPFLGAFPENLLLSDDGNKSLGSTVSEIFETTLIIKEGESAVFHDGSVLRFKPGHGIIVFGALHLLGQRDRRIVLQSSDSAPWLGIVLNPGGILHANYCVLENAIIGLNVSSPKISVGHLEILRPLSAGILITTAYDGILDLDQSVVLKSRKNGIQISKRQMFGTIILRNAILINNSKTGIAFENAVGNISLQNIVLDNNGPFAIRIHREEKEALNSIYISNLTVRRQERGNGPIQLNLNIYQPLVLNPSNYVSNTFPSVIIYSRCHLNENQQKSRKILLENSFSGNNENLVVRLILDGCTNGKIPQNIFIKNNEAVKNGSLSIRLLSKTTYVPKYYWRNGDIRKVEKRILSGNRRINPNDRAVKAVKRAVIDCSDVAKCSNNGRCVGLNECVCKNGYGGPNCTIINCFAFNNCSKNGYCIAPDVCECFEGWSGEDCSHPTCHLLNNCAGHGTCVSLNECECEPNFEGADCSMQVLNCSLIGCNNHGSCIDGKCICETGWTGPLCSKAQCDHLNDCSGFGICVRPQICECFRGFTGDDCSICEGSVCDLCDAKCIHGYCNPTTKSCICGSGWTGPNCDTCAVEKCDILSSVLYVMPTAAGIHQKNTEILVHGIDLPLAPSKRYTCLYGSIASKGFYVSSSLVRCTIPELVLPGRYLFSVIPHGSNKPIPFADRRLIHFTLYDECNPIACKGYCIGAICVCPTNREGLLCEQPKIRSKIKHESLDNEKLTKALEGQPYSVKMPIQQEKTIFNVDTDAKGLIIYPNGMVFWPRPIGREQPYTVNVTTSSLAGECLFSWNLTVRLTYIPIITKVETIRDTSIALIKGIVNYNEKDIGEVPVRILVHQGGKIIEDKTIMSTSDGRFKFEYFPFDQAVFMTAVAVHPGTNNISSYLSSTNSITWRDRTFEIIFDPVVDMKPGEYNDANYQIKNIDSQVLFNCQMEIIAPRDKLEIVKYEKILKALGPGESASIKATYALSDMLDDTVAILQFKCADTPKKLIRQQIRTNRERFNFSSIPSELLISISPQAIPKIITVDIVNENGYQFDAAPRISIEPNNGPLFLVSTRPSVSHFTEFSNYYSTLTLFLSYRTLTGSSNITTADKVTLLDGKNKQLLTIPYRVVHTVSDLFDFHVTVRDELSALNPNHIVDNAQIILRNEALGYIDRKQTTAHESVVFFSITEGTYLLTVKSAIHETVTMIIQPSHANSSLAVFIPLASPYIPAIEDEKLSLEEMNEHRMVPFLELHATPSVISLPQNGTKEMELLIHSNSNGPNDGFAVVSSIEIQNQKHIPFTFATADLRNGLGAGDGYRLQCKLSAEVIKMDRADACTVFSLQIPYFYALPNSMSNYVRNMMLLVDSRKSDDEVHLCKVGLLQSVPKKIPIWTKTTIYCDCTLKAKERCRRKYVSSAACGTAWKDIPDDTISLQIIAIFIVLIANCQEAGVDFHRLKQSLLCVSLLDSQCPALWHRLSLTDNGLFRGRQYRTQLFDQLPLVNKETGSLSQKYFPARTILETQTVNTGALYSAFFEQLNVVLPFKYFEEIRSNQWFDKFFESISDSSEDGLIISETEFNKLKGEKGGVQLARLWNATVAEWSTTWSATSNVTVHGIKFMDARQLIIRSDQLKTLTRQYGVENPFSLLHEHMGSLLSWPSESVSGWQNGLESGNEDEDICAYTYTLIIPPRPYENRDFQVMLRMINKKNDSLETVKVTLEMLRSRFETAPIQFRIESATLDGISSIDGISKLPPNASFTAHWNLRPLKSARLTQNVEYQALLILQFTRNGHQNLQQIATQTIIIRPRPSLKIYYFISDLLPAEKMEDVHASLPLFSVMIAFMNTGYSSLRNVEIEETRLSVFSKFAVKNPIPYHITDISNDGNKIDADSHIKIGAIDSGRTVNIMYNVSTDSGQDGEIRDFKITVSVNGDLIALEDSRTFFIQQFISSTKFLVSVRGNSSSLFYYDVQRTALRTVAPLIFVDVNENSGISDGKPYRQQTASFRLAKLPQHPTSFYGRIAFPVNLEPDFEVLRMHQIGKDGSQKLVDPRYVWSSNTGSKSVHFIDNNPPITIDSIAYEVIYGNVEQFLRPRFEFPIIHVPLITTNWPHIGSEIARIRAVSPSQSRIRYELYTDQEGVENYFGMNPETGTLIIKKEIAQGVGANYCMTVRATDEHGRWETTAVTVDFSDFVKDCRKIKNFNGLKPLVYSSTIFNPIKVDVEDRGTNGSTESSTNLLNLYTSKISTLVATTLLPSVSKTGTVDEMSTSRTGEFGDSYSTTAKKFTKMGTLMPDTGSFDSSFGYKITTEPYHRSKLASTFGASHSFNSTMQMTKNIIHSTSNSNEHGDGSLIAVTTNIVGTDDIALDNSYLIETYRNDSKLSENELNREYNLRTNGSENAPSGRFISGDDVDDNDELESKNLWYFGTTSEITSTDGDGFLLSASDGINISGVDNKSTTSPKSDSDANFVTFGNEGISIMKPEGSTVDDVSEFTGISATSMATYTSTLNEDYEAPLKYYFTYSTDTPSASVHILGTAPGSSSLSDNQITWYIAPPSFSYNISTENSTFFYLPSQITEILTPSSVGVDKLTAVAYITSNANVPTRTRIDGSEKHKFDTSLQEGRFTISPSSSSLTPRSVKENEEIASVFRPTTEYPTSSLHPKETFVDFEDVRDYSEKACRLKDTKPIWSLICDLSKTARHRKIV